MLVLNSQCRVLVSILIHSRLDNQSVRAILTTALSSRRLSESERVVTPKIQCLGVRLEINSFFVIFMTFIIFRNGQKNNDRNVFSETIHEEACLSCPISCYEGSFIL